MTPAFSPTQTSQYYSQPIYVSRSVFYQGPQPTLIWNSVTPRPVPLASTSPNLTKLFAHLDFYQPKPETSIEPEPIIVPTTTPAPMPTATPMPTSVPRTLHTQSTNIAHAAAAIVVDVQPEQQPIARRSRIVAVALGFGLFFILIPLFWQLYVRILKIITIIKEDKEDSDNHETG